MEFDEISRSGNGYVSCMAIIILLIKKKIHYGIQKSFERNFHQGIKPDIIYFSLTDINIRTVMILFLIHKPSLHIHKS